MHFNDIRRQAWPAPKQGRAASRCMSLTVLRRYGTHRVRSSAECSKLTSAAATLHCAHDISGLRAGTLPGVVQQNAFLGLPITLMPEETAHLVNSGELNLPPPAEVHSALS